ncbi:lysine-2,3-aminomutase-like protein [Camelimonas abortus]|uniref:Lysine-2,3-aminomutase-like protein n=1 Tax=Camelimonas abortus TaxID=1017184 RepID=A0ABV7LD14_9HYPH
MAGKTITSVSGLIAAGLAGDGARAALEQVAARYAVAVTPAMADLIPPHAPDDPVALQFVPQARELETGPEELADPIGDDAHSPVHGLVHRYRDRALLKLASVCPVYCRFCFRREMVGPGGAAMLGEAELEAVYAYLAARPEIWEVVVSGGDPLALSPRRIAAVMRRLADISHVRVVRFHSRVPLVAPERITPELVAALKACDRTVWVVLHVNCAREFTEPGRAALARLADAGVPLLSQSVLLRGVNDTPEALEALLRACVENRVKPYYLHHGDLAPGTSHLRASIAEGQALLRTLRGRLSGVAQPTYVLDIPGGYGKSPIGPAYICEDPQRPGAYRVTDPSGGVHAYPPPVGGDGEGR